MMTSEERTNKNIAFLYGVDLALIKPEQHLENDLEGDSLDSVELCMALEDEFGVEIPDHRWEKVKTVADVYAVVAEYAPKGAV